MPMLIGIIVCVFLIILRELEKSDTRRILDKAKDMSFINKELESIQRKRQSNRELSMTREEEISNAVDTIFPIPPSEKGRKYEQALMATGFEAGVKWADEHHKSPWISVEDDLPCNHGELMEPICQLDNRLIYETKRVFVHCSNNSFDTAHMINFYNRWKWYPEDIEVKHWMPIPDLKE